MIETDRLFLRQWRDEDILPFSEINRDAEVMEFLPKCLSLEETVQFYNRIVAEHNAYGYGLSAVEIKNSGNFIGYVGFHHFDFDAEFSPGIEIGWRLAKEHWNKGYWKRRGSLTLWGTRDLTLRANTDNYIYEGAKSRAYRLDL